MSALVRRPPCGAHPAQPAAAACAGCGVFLCGACAGEPRRCVRCRGGEHPVPWEDRRRGWVGGYFATLGRLIDPGTFFGTLPTTGGLRAPLGFAVLSASLGALGAGVQALFSAFMIGSVFETALPGLRQQLDPRVFELLQSMPQLAIKLQLISLLLAPLLSAAHLLVLSALTHPLARWLGGKGSFEATFRVLAYANAVKILDAVPMGNLLGFVLGLTFTTMGMRRAHGVSGGAGFFLAIWPLLAGLALLLLSLLLFASLLAARIH